MKQTFLLSALLLFTAISIKSNAEPIYIGAGAIGIVNGIAIKQAFTSNHPLKAAGVAAILSILNAVAFSEESLQGPGTVGFISAVATFGVFGLKSLIAQSWQGNATKIENLESDLETLNKKYKKAKKENKKLKEENREFSEDIEDLEAKIAGLESELRELHKHHGHDHGRHKHHKAA